MIRLWCWSCHWVLWANEKSTGYRNWAGSFLSDRSRGKEWIVDQISHGMRTHEFCRKIWKKPFFTIIYASHYSVLRTNLKEEAASSCDYIYPEAGIQEGELWVPGTNWLIYCWIWWVKCRLRVCSRVRIADIYIPLFQGKTEMTDLLMLNTWRSKDGVELEILSIFWAAWKSSCGYSWQHPMWTYSAGGGGGGIDVFA